MARARPRGRLRHYLGLLSPDAALGTPLAFERNGRQRLDRLARAATLAARERRRPSARRIRALQVGAGGRLRFVDTPAPAPPGPHGAVVRPIASATCDIDCPIALGAMPFPLPLHLGHECVAEVLSVGERVESVRSGDRVVVPFQINCGTCVPCRSGRTGNCTSVPPFSMYGMGLLAGHWGGAFADELAVPYADAMLVHLPAEIDPLAAASAADNLCDAYRHIAPHLPALTSDGRGEEVLILAAMSQRFRFSASMPLYTALIARAFGAREVLVADARPYVRAHVERLGFEALAPRAVRRRPRTALVVDITAGDLPLALAATAPDGICTSSGSFHRGARIPTLAMYTRNATLYFGRAHARAIMPEVLELIAQRRLDPQLVTTQVAALDEAPRALREHVLGAGVKTVLTA
jgi:alcohol dehydrogenase